MTTNFSISGNILTINNIFNTNTFEIVEKIPSHFLVWNIGENMGTHEYIPLCELLHPEIPGRYEINVNTLKAIKVTPEEWGKITKAAMIGVGNLEAAEKALKCKRNGYWSRRKKAAAELTIDIYKRLSK